MTDTDRVQIVHMDKESIGPDIDFVLPQTDHLWTSYDHTPAELVIPRLADADIVKHRAVLDCLKILDQDLVLLKPVGGHGHGDRCSERSSFRDADDQDGYRGDYDLGIDTEAGEEGFLAVECQDD